MLEFNSYESCFDFAIAVESSYADADELDAIAYLNHLNARSFGGSVVHSGINPERVQAFSADHYLFVCRTNIKSCKTRIFKYSAVHGLLLIEACKIVEWHHQTVVND